MEMIWLALGAILLIGILMATHNLRRVLTIMIRAAAGGFAIWGINFLLGYFGLNFLTLGINPLTVGIVAFLGMPGIVTVYGLNYLL